MDSLSSQFTGRPQANRLWFLAILLFCTICSDQITKYVARSLLVSANEKLYFSGLIKFSLIENHGGFLGIVSNLPAGARFFFLNICVALLLFGCLACLLWFSKQNSRTWIPLSLITGGGLSNLLDRLIGDGGVTDFMSIGTGYLQTGIFNLADVFILFGSFLLGFHLLRSSDNDLR
jgi:signal peptidase II